MDKSEIDRIRQDATNASVEVGDNTGAMCAYVFALCDEVERLRVRDAKVADAILMIHGGNGYIPTGSEYRVAQGTMVDFACEVKHE